MEEAKKLSQDPDHHEESTLEDSAESSILEIVVDKYSSVEQTISLLKKEIASHETDRLYNIDQSGVEPECKSEASTRIDKPEFEGLINLFSDTKVQSMIKSVAGSDTHELVCDALGSISSNESLYDKRKALSAGIQHLHSNLKGKVANIKDDPKFAIVLGIAGLSARNVKLD